MRALPPVGLCLAVLAFVYIYTHIEFYYNELLAGPSCCSLGQGCLRCPRVSGPVGEICWETVPSISTSLPACDNMAVCLQNESTVKPAWLDVFETTAVPSSHYHRKTLMGNHFKDGVFTHTKLMGPVDFKTSYGE